MTTTPSRARAFPIWAIVVAAAAAACGLWLGARVLSPSTPNLANAVLYPQPRAVPEFALTQANGKPLTNADWRGHWTVAYFGYTSCPDVCPTAMAAFKSTWAQLKQRGLEKKVQVDFISIDPERDVPETLGKYVAFFSPDFVAATGSDAQLTKLTRALGLLYTRSKDDKGNVEVDHSGSAVILDPDAHLVGIFRPPFTGTAVADDLATLIAQGR